MHSDLGPQRLVIRSSAWKPGPSRLEGSTVEANDARHLAAALERFVNGEAADSGNLDLAALVCLINFLRGGAVEIR